MLNLIHVAVSVRAFLPRGRVGEGTGELFGPPGMGVEVHFSGANRLKKISDAESAVSETF